MAPSVRRAFFSRYLSTRSARVMRDPRPPVGRQEETKTSMCALVRFGGNLGERQTLLREDTNRGRRLWQALTQPGTGGRATMWCSPMGCGGGMSAPASSAEAGSCGTPGPLPAEPERRLLAPLAADALVMSGTIATPPSERPALPGSEPGPPASKGGNEPLQHRPCKSTEGLNSQLDVEVHMRTPSEGKGLKQASLHLKKQASL